jgi:hypothetical protein
MKRRAFLTLAGMAAATPAMAWEGRPVTAAQAVASAMMRPDLQPYRKQIEAAMACLDAFMVAWNARDIAAYERTFNFPSVRFASNNLRLINAGDQKPSMFNEGSLADWDHSAWERREVIHAGVDKVHIDTRFTRYRKDGTVIGGFDSLYVVNNEKGRWGVKIRSSFAP